MAGSGSSANNNNNNNNNNNSKANSNSNNNNNNNTNNDENEFTGGEDLTSYLGSGLSLTLVSSTNSVTSSDSDSGKSPTVVQGLLWTYDPVTGFVVIQTSPVPDFENPSSGPIQPESAATGGRHPSFRLIKVSQISKLEVLTKSPQPQLLKGSVANVSIQATRERERTAIAKASRVHPKGVTQWGVEVYDALGKTLPVRWHELKIVVMDELIISPPYRLEDVKTPQSQGAGKFRLERVRKVLEGERARLLRQHPHLQEQAGENLENGG